MPSTRNVLYTACVGLIHVLTRCSTYIDGVHLVLVLHILGGNSLPPWPGSAHTLPLPIGLILPHLLLDARHLLLVLGGGAAHGEHNLAPEDGG